ncbi:hypothetical protein AB0B25_31995 [Nocardia sp. NPDC049190]|uniref:hypothetical protein n=1 Tax=Nocardia sp. NPDC049190 TaxID=3155650 RepID=UPI0033ED461B
MAIRETSKATALRPSRLNFAGWCKYCLTQNCSDARCIETHARTEWQLCGKCGGTEYVGGHIDPMTACQRCDCFGGVIEVDAYTAEVVELRPEPVASGYSVARPVVYESWPAGGGAPVRWVR